MDKHKLDEKITQASKSILSYCMARVSDQHDAEDLAQDIIVEIMKSSGTIRDDKAFYGFMWAVAGNVYKQWCRKKASRKECELDYDICEKIDDDKSDVYLLRRELSLLAKRYRRATTLYYLENKSCAQISSDLSISESMVKYLLFKARKILKDGMNMERNFGEQSYNPKTLYIMYMGEGPNHYWDLVEGNMIRQNILWACYNDRLTEEDIALQIGVSLPYIENDLKKLVDTWLLVKDGSYYRTNVIILTEDFTKEKAVKLLPLQKQITGCITDFIGKHEEAIRDIGFYGSDMSKNSLKWQIACIILQHAYSKVADKYFVPGKAPLTAFGEHAFVWGQEHIDGGFNCCNISADEWNTNISMYFMDWVAKPNTHHNDFYSNPKLVKLYDKLVHGLVCESEKNPKLVKLCDRFAHGLLNEIEVYEREMLAELVRKGYARKQDGQVRASMPVFTKEEYERLILLLKPVIVNASELFEKMHAEITAVLRNHAPSHMNKQVESIACMSLFNDGAYTPVSILNKNDYLSTDWDADEIATAYVILK